MSDIAAFGRLIAAGTRMHDGSLERSPVVDPTGARGLAAPALSRIPMTAESNRLVGSARVATRRTKGSCATPPSSFHGAICRQTQEKVPVNALCHIMAQIGRSWR